MIFHLILGGRNESSLPKGSDILFPYRSPSPAPHPDPTQHPKMDPKRTRNRPETDPNGPKRTRNGPKRTRNGPISSSLGWDPRGVRRDGGGFVGVVREKEQSLPKGSYRTKNTMAIAVVVVSCCHSASLSTGTCYRFPWKKQAFLSPHRSIPYSHSVLQWP